MNVGVLLAAGASTRMGRPKALVQWQGQSFFAHGVRALWSACDIVLAVLGSHAADVRHGVECEFNQLVEAGDLSRDLHEAHRHGARALEVQFVTNRAWARGGMLSSTRVGLAAALRIRPAAILVLPVDHPEVRGATVLQMSGMMAQALKAFGGRASRDFAYALIPRYRGQRGHPLAMTPALARAICRDKAAENLGDAVRRSSRLVGFMDVADKGVVTNRNTPKR